MKASRDSLPCTKLRKTGAVFFFFRRDVFRSVNTDFTRFLFYPPLPEFFSLTQNTSSFKSSWCHVRPRVLLVYLRDCLEAAEARWRQKQRRRSLEALRSDRLYCRRIVDDEEAAASVRLVA